MERIEVDLLTSQGNYAIVRLPARQFPGVLLQGDSLSILEQDTRELANRIAALDDTLVDHELVDQAQDLADELTGLLTHYQATLQRHDILLPYNPKTDPGLRPGPGTASVIRKGRPRGDHLSRRARNQDSRGRVQDVRHCGRHVPELRAALGISRPACSVHAA
ncbi:hypothetical protein ORV05_34475 [Amycolatopsis cynarae]|uniref:Uncharacterized protein n=1 Tax=Amycolatopsis cynarae TaxID=2995223 RepID=A0ABY7BGK9_9PSEU|nr:hypothetical protein [Amycolatopsis sp. HUAS 11-8]WAL70021.1 hypothetical protein ORV05_34475 [Amycolatopsis sp. HUAS 11-8]